ncbi:MAG: spore cortex biosynthesis protein YabQ [Clostridia bacterium]|nr:spore cortex biosynthesis protein YabQ [Clostridia bacterium]
MTVSSSVQLDVFFVCIVFGIASGVIFDLERSIRKIYGGKNIATIAEDVVFAVVCITALIILCYFFDEGRIRYYHILGACFGVLFYALFLSGAVLKGFCFIHMFFIKAVLSPLLKLIRFIFSPFILFFKKTASIIKRSYKKLKKILRGVKIKKKRIKKIMKML